MKMKNRKGSTLVMTLIVFVVLMIFGTFILSFMVTENKMSINHQYKTQAHYIARSGAVAVEAAILDMDENEVKKIIDELDKGLINAQEMMIGEGKVNVLIRKDANKLIIESIGEINKVNNLVVKIVELEQNSSKIDVKHAMFSSENVKFENGTIHGDIATNKSIYIKGNPSLNGNVYIMENQILDAEKWWKNSWANKYTTKNLVQERTYQPIKLPLFPINNSTVDFLQGDSNQTTISTSKDYNIFEINNNTKVYIDTTKKDITLNIKQFNLNNGHIIILGNNKLTLYVKNMITGAGSTINYNKEIQIDSKKVNIFHNGNDKLRILGNVKISGNIYIDKASLEIGGSGSILGNIYCNGNEVSLSGNSDITKGILYAPNSEISFTGSGKVYGAVIGRAITITGGGMVTFDPKYIDTSVISTFSEGVSFKPGYFK